ncbi:unnamed protein product [Orchesella dallaii]|uniref:Uncharacterized protein n=1 Tax=Orchesella dallaii TaxID=48710 RepID=A0ABP1R2I3_9HEXA
MPAGAGGGKKSRKPVKQTAKKIVSKKDRAVENLKKALTEKEIELENLNTTLLRTEEELDILNERWDNFIENEQDRIRQEDEAHEDEKQVLRSQIEVLTERLQDSRLQQYNQVQKIHAVEHQNWCLQHQLTKLKTENRVLNLQIQTYPSLRYFLPGLTQPQFYSSEGFEVLHGYHQALHLAQNQRSHRPDSRSSCLSNCCRRLRRRL